MAANKRYKLLLTDDEPWALIGLKECIDWGEAGFDIVAECDCGEAALKAADEVHPDAVITDIRMPDMSGLELIRRLKEKDPDIQCAVVSAFSDFEMAREAIKLTACSYMLKPLSEDEVSETARRLKELLEARTASSERSASSAKSEDAEENSRKETYVEFSPDHPVLPETPPQARSLWLVLSERPVSPSFWKEDTWLVPVKAGNDYGMLCDRLPEELPKDTGLSCAVNRNDRPEKLLETAEASLKGGFLYPEYAVIQNTPSIVASIQLYLYRHLKENISLKDLSDTFFLTKTYLCDIFKEQTGKTILEFLREIRLYKAAELLRKTEETINEVASECGYNDYSYFIRHFKKIYGSTPDQYRKNY